MFGSAILDRVVVIILFTLSWLVFLSKSFKIISYHKEGILFENFSYTPSPSPVVENLFPVFLRVRNIWKQLMEQSTLSYLVWFINKKMVPYIIYTPYNVKTFRNFKTLSISFVYFTVLTCS